MGGGNRLEDTGTGAAGAASPSTERDCKTRHLPIERLHHLEGVGRGWRLVGTISPDAGKPEREASRVLRALLNVVEGDLDDELWPNRDAVRSRATASSRSRFVCAASISSVSPLKVFPNITKPPLSGLAESAADSREQARER